MKNVSTSKVFLTALFCAMLPALTIAQSESSLTSAQSTTTGGSAAAKAGLSEVAEGAISESQLARANAKFIHAMAIANQFESQAVSAGINADNWRTTILTNLMKAPEDSYATVSLAPTYVEAQSTAIQIGRTAATAVAPKSLGTATSDLVYVPITPCRVVDTRAGGAAVPAGTVSSFFFTAANVGSGSCTVVGQIPGGTAAAAFAANITVDETGLTGFSAGAYLEAFPQGGSTSTSFLNFGPNQIIANAGIITLNQGNSEFSIVASAPTQVIIDTYGVFIAPQATALDCTMTAENNVTVGANLFNNVAPPACPAGYTQVAAYCRMSSYTDNLSVVTNICGGHTASASALIYASARCCRIPGR